MHKHTHAHNKRRQLIVGDQSFLKTNKKTNNDFILGAKSWVRNPTFFGAASANRVLLLLIISTSSYLTNGARQLPLSASCCFTVPLYSIRSHFLSVIYIYISFQRIRVDSTACEVKLKKEEECTKNFNKNNNKQTKTQKPHFPFKPPNRPPERKIKLYRPRLKECQW